MLLTLIQYTSIMHIHYFLKLIMDRVDQFIKTAMWQTKVVCGKSVYITLYKR